MSKDKENHETPPGVIMWMNILKEDSRFIEEYYKNNTKEESTTQYHIHSPEFLRQT